MYFKYVFQKLITILNTATIIYIVTYFNITLIILSINLILKFQLILNSLGIIEN